MLICGQNSLREIRVTDSQREDVQWVDFRIKRVWGALDSLVNPFTFIPMKEEGGPKQAL